MQFWNTAVPRVIPFSAVLLGKRNSVIAVAENAVLPIFVMLLSSSNSTVARRDAPLNAPFAISTMDFGNLILLMPEE